MNKFFLPFLILCSHFCLSQGGTWTWISGDSTLDSPGVYGTQGVPSINNHPPGLYEAAEWKDKQGNFWIYGGWTPYAYSDLWKFNPSTNEWTWVKGNGGTNVQTVYGTQGVPNPLNTPGERQHAAATWVDSSNTFWLFGGANFTSDLWKYDIGSNQWTWMKGDTIVTNSVHGTQGVPSPLNIPGGRYETCSSWTDSLNNLWLFGGEGYDDNGTMGFLNDLMKYDISVNEWTWMKGSAFIDTSANYGTKGVVSISNDPGGRWTYTKWKDMKGNFWLIGGRQGNSLNDVWKYNLDVNEWTWMNGTNVINDPGNYRSNCVFDSINLPQARYEHRSAVTDNCGSFWLFGGHGALGYLNDLWVFDPQQLKWNLINGTNVGNQQGSYGNLGTTSSSNIPPSRRGPVAWWGNDNNFYMFGGLHNNDLANTYSDVWVFNPDTNCVPICGVITDMTDFELSNTISIYPNPAINQLTIHTSSLHANEAVTVSIMNVLGQDVSTPLNVRLSLSDVEVDVSKLSSGIYFVQVVGEKGRWVGKFVKSTNTN